MAENQPDDVDVGEKSLGSVPKDEMALVHDRESEDLVEKNQENDNASNSSTTTMDAPGHNREESGTGHDRHVSFDTSVSHSRSLKKNRLFGRQKPVHTVLGGGRCKDLILFKFLK